MLKVNTIEKLETIEDVLKFGNMFVNNGLLRGFKRLADEQKKLKYPKRLHEHKPTLMVKEDFYGWNI